MLLAAVFTRPLDRVSTVDPLFATSTFECYAIKLVYETPLEIDFEARPYKLVPGACFMPEVSADGRTYVFRMRSPRVSAADAARSIGRLLDPETVSPNFWIVKDIESVTVRDERTLEIKLKSRCHFFPWLMALPQTGIMLPDSSGTGEFELERWRKNHEMVFRRRNLSSLPADPGRIDEVRYVVVDDTITQWLMFLRGELDFIEDVSRDCYDAVTEDPRILEKADAKSYSIPLLQFNYIGINMTDGVLGKNVYLRQALNAAFDSESWRRFYSDMVVAADTPVPPGVASGRLTTPFEFSYDLEKARKLLAKAGYPGGIDPATGRRLELTLTTGRASQDSREKGELMASFYEKIGIRLKLDFMTWDAFLTAVNEGRVQLFDIAWLADYPDAQNFMQLFYSKCYRPGPNRMGYVSAEFDRAYEAALAAPDDATRERHWHECQRIIRRDCPLVMLHFKKSFSVAGKGLKGLVPGDYLFGAERYLRKAVR